MKLKLLFFMMGMIFFVCASDYSSEEDQDTAWAFGRSPSVAYKEYKPPKEIILVASDDDEPAAFNDDIQDGLDKQDMPLAPSSDSDDDELMRIHAKYGAPAVKPVRARTADPVAQYAELSRLGQLAKLTRSY